MFHVKHETRRFKIKDVKKLRSKIKWRKQDIENVRNVVRQFNRKLTMTERKHPETKGKLPDRLTVADVMKQIQTRKDYNKLVNSYKRFYQRKDSTNLISNKNGLEVTKWEKREAEINLRAVNRKRAARRKSSGATTFTGTMGKLDDMHLNKRHYDFDSFSSKSLWDSFKKSVDRETLSQWDFDKMSVWYGNLRKAINNQFGNDRGLNDTLDRINPEKLLEAFFINPFIDFDYVYDKWQEIEKRYSKLEIELNKLIRDNELSIEPESIPDYLRKNKELQDDLIKRYREIVKDV